MVAGPLTAAPLFYSPLFPHCLVLLTCWFRFFLYVWLLTLFRDTISSMLSLKGYLEGIGF